MLLFIISIRIIFILVPFPILICNIKNENNIIGFIQIKTKQFNHEKLMKVINSEKDTLIVKKLTIYLLIKNN